MLMPKIGERWPSGRVTCLDIYDSRQRVERSGGYDMVGVTMIDLECECGKMWTIEKGEWKGKRFMKDCGCGIAETSRPVILTAYIKKQETFDTLRRMAFEAGLSLSTFANNIMEAHVASKASTKAMKAKR